MSGIMSAQSNLHDNNRVGLNKGNPHVLMFFAHHPTLIRLNHQPLTHVASKLSFCSQTAHCRGSRGFNSAC